MSIQKATVNCRRCYALAQIVIGHHMEPRGHEKEIQRTIMESDQIYAARNEAMRALEEERVLAVNDNCEYFTRESGQLVKQVNAALDACMKCDYRDSRIAVANGHEAESV